MNEVKVEIYSKTYILRGDKSPAQLRKMAREVDFRMQEVAEVADGLDLTRTAVLAALNLAEEYLELQERYDRVVQMLEEEYRKTKNSDDPVIPMKRQDGGESSVEGEFR